MPDSAQTLREFTENLLSDLESGTLSVHEAITACSQYSYLREALGAQKAELVRAELIGEEEFAQAFTGIMGGVLTSLSDVPGFQNQSPDRPSEEKIIRDTASLRKAATERVQGSLRPDTAEHKNGRREFIHTLVDRFSSRTLAVSDRQMEDMVDRSLARAAQEATTPQTRERFTELMVASVEAGGTTLPADQKTALTADIREALSAQEEFFGAMSRQARKASAIYEALSENPDLARPDVLADVVLNAPAGEPLSETRLRATKLAGVAASLDTQGARVGGRLQFFTAGGARGIAKGLQQGADGLLSIVKEPVRDMVLAEKVNGTLRSMLSNTQRFVDRLGENFVHSAVFANVSQNLTKQLSERPTGGQVRTVFDDVFTSVFRGPAALPLAHGTQERILDYFELARANAAAPVGRKFLPAGMMPWEVFRIRPQAGMGAGAARGRGIRFGGGTALIPFIGLGAVGRAAGNMFSAMVDRTTSFLLTNPFIPQQMSRSRRAAAVPLPLSEDLPLITALVVVVVIVLLYLFPSPLNLSQLSHSSKISALFASLENKLFTNICEDNSTNPICAFEPCTGDCRWPTTGAIIQGPFAQCDDHTHSVVDAVDFKGTYLQPIYSVTDGTVVSVLGGCADNPAPFGGSISQGCNNNYGNYVEIRTSRGDVLRYSHLSVLFIDKISPGQSVKQGDIIGKMDNNGSSGSHHLHFELRGGSESNSKIASYLPGDAAFAQKLYKCINASGCSACPQM